MRSALAALLFLVLASVTLAQEPALAEPEPMAPSKLYLALGQTGHSAPVAHIAFTRDGLKLLTVGRDNTIQLWNAATGEHLRTLRLPWREGPPGHLIGYIGPESKLAVSPDGGVLAISRPVREYHVAPGGMNAVGMKGRFEHEVSLIHLDSGLIKALPGAQGAIRLLSFSPDGDMLAAAGVLEARRKAGGGDIFSEWGADIVWLWRGLRKAWPPDTPSPTLWKTHDKGTRFHRIEDICWAPDGKTLAECWSRTIPDGKGGLAPYPIPLDLWGLDSPDKPPHEFSEGLPPEREGGPRRDAQDKSPRELAKGLFRSVVWSPRGARIAATEADAKTVRVWAPDALHLRTVTTEDVLLAPPSFRTENEVLFVGRRAAEPATGTASRSDLQNLKTTRPTEFLRFGLPDALHQVAVAAMGERMAMLAGRTSDEVALIDLKPNAQPFPLAVAMPATPFVAFNKSGNKLAWTGPDRTKLVAGIDLQTAEPVPAAELTAAEFGPPGQNATSAVGDRQAVPRFARGGLIDISVPGLREPGKKGLPPRRLVFSVFASGPEWVITTPEGYYAASPCGEKLVGWHANNGPSALASFYPLDRFRKKLYRPDVIALVLEKGSVATALKVANALRDPETIASVADLLPPRCRVDLVSHEKGTVTLRVRATAQAKGQPVEGLKLLLDGRPTGTRGAVVDDGTADKEFPGGKASVDETWTFDLPGEKAVGAYQIAVLARSKDAAAPSNAVAVTFVDPTKVPALHVLAVGINKYAQTALELKFAAKDAAEVADAFQAHAKDGLFSGVHVHKLLDAQATRQGVLDAVAAVRKVAKRNDLCVVFFAGHGAKAKEQFYLLTVEADVKALESSALSGADLRKSLGGFPCQVLLMLDACHSAGFGEKGTLKAASLERATDEATRSLTEDDVGVAVMAAAMGHEFALERDGNGLFTRAVLDALGRAEGVPFNRSNQILYAHHLQAFVFDRVAERSVGRQHPYLNLPWVVQSFPIARVAQH